MHFYSFPQSTGAVTTLSQSAAQSYSNQAYTYGYGSSATSTTVAQSASTQPNFNAFAVKICVFCFCYYAGASNDFGNMTIVFHFAFVFLAQCYEFHLLAGSQQLVW